MSLLTNLDHYWKLDEAAASDAAVDAVGSETLPASNNPTATGGKLNGGRGFSAAFSRSLISPSGTLNPGDTDFTFQAWVYLTDKTVIRTILSKWATVSFVPNYTFIMGYANTLDRYFWEVTPDGTTGSAGGVAADNFGIPAALTWHLVHAWHDSINNLIGISVNAGAADTVSYSTGCFSNTSARIEFGSNEHASTGFWEGIIDEVGFWSRVLTSGERTALYNGGAGLDFSAFSGGGGGTRRRAKVFRFGF
jgi:hypothetical protein